MGWLKRLFAQKKTFEEVQAWINEEYGQHAEKRKGLLAGFEHELPLLKQKVLDGLNALEEAELLNKNIPERAKHYMDGNRDHFVKLTNRFLDNIVVPNTEEDFASLNESFKQYVQNTTRAGTILSEFLRGEVQAIRSSIHEIEQKLNDIRSHDKGLEQIQELKDRLTAITSIAQENKEQQAQRDTIQQEIETLQQKEIELKAEKERLQNGPEYSSLKEELIASSAVRRETEHVIAELFQPLTGPLKKYAHSIHDSALEAYVENPLQSLVQDYELKLLKHVEGFTAMIERGDIELKQETKTRESLELLNKEYLAKIVHAYGNAKKQESDLQKGLAQKPVMQQIEQVNTELKHVLQQIETRKIELDSISLSSDDAVREELKILLKQRKIVLI